MEHDNLLKDEENLNQDDFDGVEDVSGETLIDGDGILYTSGDVAKQLNMNRDLVRYYTKEYEDFVHPVRTRDGKGGHYRYRAEDIQTLRNIMSLLKKNNTPSEVKAILKDDKITMMYLSQTENPDFMKLLMENNKYLTETIFTKLNEQLLSFKNNMLEDHHLNEDIMTELEFLKKENLELKETMNKIFDILDDKEKEKKKGILKKIFGK